jgi:hypothetical protein
MIALFVAAGLSVAGSASAQMYASKTAVTPMSKDGYAMAKTNADAQYKIDKDACSSLAGNAKDICMAEAKGKDTIAKADAEVAYQNTAKHRESARVAHARRTTMSRLKSATTWLATRRTFASRKPRLAGQRQSGRQGRPGRGRYAPGRGRQADGRSQGSECRQARRGLQGRDREVRRAGRRREGFMRQRRQGAFAKS